MLVAGLGADLGYPALHPVGVPNVGAGPGVLLALDKLSSLPPGVTVGLESLLE